MMDSRVPQNFPPPRYTSTPKTPRGDPLQCPSPRSAYSPNFTGQSPGLSFPSADPILLSNAYPSCTSRPDSLPSPRVFSASNASARAGRIASPNPFTPKSGWMIDSPVPQAVSPSTYAPNYEASSQRIYTYNMQPSPKRSPFTPPKMPIMPSPPYSIKDYQISSTHHPQHFSPSSSIPTNRSGYILSSNQIDASGTSSRPLASKTSQPANYQSTFQSVYPASFIPSPASHPTCLSRPRTSPQSRVTFNPQRIQASQREFKDSSPFRDQLTYDYDTSFGIFEENLDSIYSSDRDTPVEISQSSTTNYSSTSQPESQPSSYTSLAAQSCEGSSLKSTAAPQTNSEAQSCNRYELSDQTSLFPSSSSLPLSTSSQISSTSAQVGHLPPGYHSNVVDQRVVRSNTNRSGAPETTSSGLRNQPSYFAPPPSTTTQPVSPKAMPQRETSAALQVPPAQQQHRKNLPDAAESSTCGSNADDNEPCKPTASQESTATECQNYETPQRYGGQNSRRNMRGRNLNNVRRRLDFDSDIEDESGPLGEGDIITLSQVEFMTIPEKYRTVPSFLFVAKHLDEGFFWAMVETYFIKGYWCKLEDLPETFQEACAEFNVGPDSFEYIPGFAPKWLFFLKRMDYRIFKEAVNYFFEKKRLPTWHDLPEYFSRIFSEMNITESEYYE